MIRIATADDATGLARLAAITFPLACPPGTSDQDVADFIAANLTVDHFTAYLADPERTIFVAERDGELAGYTMLIAGEPRDADAAAAISLRPTIELSKCYTHPGHHGSGISADLMQASVVAGKDRGAVGMWLGVNQHNARANRFYEKQGFVQVGTKHFTVGGQVHDDFVRERAL